MLCYRDMTFCKESTCKLFGDCPRSLTPEVLAAADRWWGKPGAPISTYTETPPCYEDRN